MSEVEHIIDPDTIRRLVRFYKITTAYLCVAVTIILLLLVLS